MPLTSVSIFIGGASLVGVPLTAGFVSKWALLTAVIAEGRWVVASLVIVSSLIAVLYVGGLLHVMLIRKRPEGLEPVKEAPLWMVLPTLLLAFSNLWYGVVDGQAADAARAAAASLVQEVTR